MSTDWIASIPAIIYFIIGLGGVAGAVLAIVKLWQTVVPARTTPERDIEIIRVDLHEIRSRVSSLEIELAKIDQPSIVRRFDGIETKIDRLYEFLIDRFADASIDRKR